MNTVVLYSGSSEHNKYRIADTIHSGRKARVLYAGRDAPQSGLALDGNPTLLFSYIQRFLEIAESTRPSSVLLIGGGALTLPKALMDRFPDIRIDVVEIDALLPELAKQYFDLRDDPRLNIIIEDGRTYITHCTSSYDLIYVDVFSAYNMPLALFSVDTVHEYEHCLKKGGVIAVNFIAKYLTRTTTLAHRLSATFDEVFQTVELYPADPHTERHASQNLVLVASGEDLIHLDYLQSAQVSLLFTPKGDAVLTDM